MNVTTSGFLNALRQHRLVDEAQVDRIELAYHGRSADARFVAEEVMKLGLLTPYQVQTVLEGKAAELSLGQHILLDLLGEGGMGQVFKARHRRLKRIDAIKVIRPDRVASKETLKRFFREAEVIAQLNHPNIVKVHDAGEEEDRHYFVMEFIDGIDLSEVLNKKGPLSVGQACACIRQAARGLQHAHEKGLIHRDIKPSNLLLARHANGNERIKILDLGLARLNEQQNMVSAMTQQGQIMGTPDFMAPEQAEDSHGVDIRADIYSLGCSLYQLLSGKPPFPGGTLLVKLFNHRTTMPARLEGVPEALWAVIEKMMAKARESRYPEPARVVAALAPFCDAEVQPPDPPPVKETDRPSGMSLLPQTFDDPPHTPPAGLGETIAPYGGDDQTGPPVSREDDKTSPLSPPEKAEASPTYLMPSAALWSLPPSSKEELARSRQPAVAPEPKTPTHRLWLLLVVVALLGGGITAAILLLRDRESTGDTPIVQIDPNKDRKGTDPAKDQDKDRKKTEPSPIKTTAPPIKKTDPPVMPPEKKAVDIAKERGSGWETRAEVKRAQNPVFSPCESRTGDRDQLDLWGTMPPRPVQAVFSLDGTRALVRSLTTITPFDLKARKPLAKLDPSQIAPGGSLGGTQPLGPVAFAPKGGYLVFATVNVPEGMVRGKEPGLVNLDTLVRVEEGKATLLYYGEEGDKTQLLTRALAFAPDGKSLLAAWKRKVVRWDMTREGTNRHAFDKLEVSDGECLAFSREDSSRFVMGCSDGYLYLLTTKLEDEETSTLARFKGAKDAVSVVTFLQKDGLVSGDATGRLCLWKVPGGKKTEVQPPQEQRDGWHTQKITCIATLGNQFATGSADGKVHLGKPDEKKPLQTFDLGKEPVLALSYSADGKELLVATEKKLGVIVLELPPIALVRAQGGNAAGLAKPSLLEP